MNRIREQRELRYLREQHRKDQRYLRIVGLALLAALIAMIVMAGLHSHELDRLRAYEDKYGSLEMAAYREAMTADE